MKTYGISYTHEGKVYAAEIEASDWSDAEARLTSLSKGEIIGEAVPLRPGYRPFSKIADTHKTFPPI